jgi:hypothetical protein
MKRKINVFFAFVASFIILGATSVSFGQVDPPPFDAYGDPFEKAAKFAVEEGSKREKATITLTKIEKANLVTSEEEGITHNLCLSVGVRKNGGKKTVNRYVTAVVHRNGEMVYSLKSWKLFKKPPECVKNSD